jgi:hypothetical protein
MYINTYIIGDIMRNMEMEDCECNCRCKGRGMHGHAGREDADMSTEGTVERLMLYKDDLAEEIKFIDKRITDLEARDAGKSSK